MWPSAVTDCVVLVPKIDPASEKAVSGPALSYVVTGSTPRNPPVRPETLASAMVLVNCRCPRWIVNVTRDPGRFERIATPTRFHECTGRPAIATILSPARSPATDAGDLGLPGAHVAVAAVAGTHRSTVNVVPFRFGSPTTPARITNSTNAKAKCMNDPAAHTIDRCQAGCDRSVRGSSAGITSSMLVVPVILTNPPSGSALTPYSVSPRILDQSVGPNPTKYWVTFIPKAFAVARWPASCSMIETSSANRKMSTPIR